MKNVFSYVVGRSTGKYALSFSPALLSSNVMTNGNLTKTIFLITKWPLCKISFP